VIRCGTSASAFICFQRGGENRKNAGAGVAVLDKSTSSLDQQHLRNLMRQRPIFSAESNRRMPARADRTYAAEWRQRSTNSGPTPNCPFTFLYNLMVRRPVAAEFRLVLHQNLAHFVGQRSDGRLFHHALTLQLANACGALLKS